jgi:hypothetical protein
MNEPTYCQNCDGVHMETRKLHPGRWLCIFHKRAVGGSFVAPNVWVEMEPYNRCININLGMCPTFTPRRESNERPGNKRPVQEERP